MPRNNASPASPAPESSVLTRLSCGCLVGGGAAGLDATVGRDVSLPHVQTPVLEALPTKTHNPLSCMCHQDMLAAFYHCPCLRFTVYSSGSSSAAAQALA
jgi:hypothetical protein